MRDQRFYLGAWLAMLPALVLLAGCGSEENAQAPVPANISGGEETGAIAARISSIDVKRAVEKLPVDLRHPEVTMETSAGQIVIRLDAEHAPGTVSNFLNYVNSLHYDGTIFHYVSADNMILGGGFSSQFELKQTLPPIRNEAHNGLSNKRGTIAMARSLDVIDSSTSQFFINLADHTDFDHRSDLPAEYGYCVFGEIIGGLDIAERISQSPTADKGEFTSTPVQPIVIKSIRQTK